MGDTVSNSSPLYISSSYNPLDGGIDELRIWSLARTGSDLQADMCSPIDSAHDDWSSLEVYFPFESDSANHSSNTLTVTTHGTPALVAY